MGSIVLLDLMGGVALLLWGLHMVRSGIMRAFGSELRRVLGTALRNRFLALLAGIGVTALLQSSTATGLLMTSFAARGLVDLVPALAVMLGANIGTTLIVQALSFDISAVAPVLFLAGLLAFNFGGRRIVPRPRPRGDRPRPYAAVPPYSTGYARPGRECSKCTRTSCRDHRRARLVRPDRRCAHLGGPFQRGGGVARHVARLFAVRESRRGPRAGPRR